MGAIFVAAVGIVLLPHVAGLDYAGSGRGPGNGPNLNRIVDQVHWRGYHYRHWWWQHHWYHRWW